MVRSRPVSVGERHLGSVVAGAEGWNFIAADPVVADLHGQRFPSPEEAVRIAALVLGRASRPPAAPPVLRRPPVLRLVRRNGEPDPA
ncbi:hypothetical protein [Paracraurococcus ruber]|uniref:Uncharacterized protein n=1 Tax=Paracraurococcus ruber TaxID=77675 RepID=A0ABS1CQL6_9PROT|nr:hypothetical protein [Paracraurococcus ruber]MBK1656645.1 hypothetical protein [Paracraurococcus ruber]TDG33732.1 hypothetical protein E2C05_02630 [Paracraurococcus ruber]